MNKKQISAAIFFTLCGLFSFNVSANNSSSDMLYHGKMKVNDQSRTSRNKAIKVLLEKTLIKISGKRDIAYYPAIQESIKNALSYTKEFGFEREQSNTFLNVEFSEKLIDELLRTNGISLWDVRRPTSVLWLVYENEQGQRQLLNAASDIDLSTIATETANNRGLPAILPLWDLDDQLVVSLSDLWGQFEDKVGEANSRYSSDYMILGKVNAVGFSYQVNWSIFKMSKDDDAFGRGQTFIRSTGNDEVQTLSQGIAQIVDHTADYFASNYSVDTSQEAEDFIISITHVDSLKTYVNIVNYLKSIKAINQITLVTNQLQTYQFKLRLIGDKQSLIDTINIDNKMTKNHSDDASEVLFEWHE